MQDDSRKNYKSPALECAKQLQQVQQRIKQGKKILDNNYPPALVELLCRQGDRSLYEHTDSILKDALKIIKFAAENGGGVNLLDYLDSKEKSISGELQKRFRVSLKIAVPYLVGTFIDDETISYTDDDLQKKFDSYFRMVKIDNNHREKLHIFFESHNNLPCLKKTLNM